MYLFSNIPVTRHEIETTEHSAAGDHDIVASNMSWPRRIAKYIVEDGRIMEDCDISMPFQIPAFNKKVNEVCTELGMRNVHGARVLAEFQDNGLLEKFADNGRIYWRFKYKIGTLTEMYGHAISVTMEPRFQFDTNDMGENDATAANPISWKGLNKRMYGKF
jgi:hypothetical protein